MSKILCLTINGQTKSWSLAFGHSGVRSGHRSNSYSEKAKIESDELTPTSIDSQANTAETLIEVPILSSGALQLGG